MKEHNREQKTAQVREFCDKEHAEILSGMQPFTITITDPADAALLFNAAIKSAVKWNTKSSMILAELLARYCNDLGDKDGIDMFLKEADDRGYRIPKWFKPLHEYIVGIADNNFNKFKADNSREQ